MFACSLPWDRLRRCALVAALSWASCAAGCSREAVQPGKSADARQEARDHKRDHGIPDHKPTTFAEAVNELPRRQQRIVAEFQAGHADRAAEQLQQLLDLVRWLPELAGDSDLKRADWETVQRVAAELELQVQLVMNAPDRPGKPEFVRFQIGVERLMPLAARSTAATGGVSATNDPSHAPKSVDEPNR